MDRILTIEDKTETKTLRRKTDDFDFSRHTRAETSALVQRMHKAMRAVSGIGLSANQIGLGLRVFVAEVPNKRGGNKFYAIFNSKIEKTAGQKLLLEEGCLSVPGKFGHVERFEKVVLTGFDKNGRPLKIKAWGLLAHVFQHETDHLDGKLFIDKAKEIYEVKNVARVAQEAMQKRYGIKPNG